MRFVSELALEVAMGPIETSTVPAPRLLVVEDSPTDQVIYRRTLRDFQVEFASSGESALTRLASEPFDLMILDYHLPRMNGEEVLSEVRDKLGLDLPIIIVTGLGSASVAVGLLKQGAFDYLTKDELHTPRVAAAVHSSLERHRLDRARIAAEAELRRRKDELETALRQLQEAQAQLVQSEKMASLGQLVAGVAHEINNPLAYVSNNLAVLDRDVRSLAELMTQYRNHLGDHLPAEIVELEERIDINYTMENLERLLSSSKQGLKRVREIVAGLRDFSRLDEAERKQIDPNEAILVTVEMVRYHVKQKGITLKLELGELPHSWCYPGKLNQVFLNLLMNAIQAVNQDGTITIRTSLNQIQKELQFEITDDGPGIPESIRGKIYDPFFTTKPQGVGTGLGLWISYNIIVNEHEGRIEVDSALGVGTTFRVIIPIKDQEADM